ncbi:hypothetical protein PPERSA_11013 [Pseudocohnilembus persalinus]|uniref:Uncharacterized protein n=1 Tax=Pseudocohnilembus persalinus TaxID=266149 RepID=A0A0V0QZY7_PSEPJ|nr:hypothetical protein PPERSA_11013 [Pseudocohnilembus persalinus]|eukprot:KRX07464.1 hypothetical protein PPERSA_11013 [Pseudocohnilembus persalinus]
MESIRLNVKQEAYCKPDQMQQDMDLYIHQLQKDERYNKSLTYGTNFQLILSSEEKNTILGEGMYYEKIFEIEDLVIGGADEQFGDMILQILDKIRKNLEIVEKNNKNVSIGSFGEKNNKIGKISLEIERVNIGISFDQQGRERDWNQILEIFQFIRPFVSKGFNIVVGNLGKQYSKIQSQNKNESELEIMKKKTKRIDKMVETGKFLSVMKNKYGILIRKEILWDSLRECYYISQ